MDEPSELLKAVCEIRDLVRLMAESAIAARDQKLRAELKRIVGKSTANWRSIFLMDGSRASGGDPTRGQDQSREFEYARQET